ncbi:hypothetical protein [Nocardia aurantiaca]|uniref:Uncharacterized protein n=1 Tax=Nocardia aurantiaca TaxID=2675850 RepID=A0A6I3L3Z1_9NOCA|nr:hypothetical protein [Nocardia aurantiaca]MTE15265.1 hypothetical protein [Nocardia aurantiaca]
MPEPSVRHGMLAAAAGLVLTVAAPQPIAAAEAPACTLIGTVGTPESGADETTAGLDAFPAAATPLPDQVFFRTTAETFNRRWTFAVREGAIFVKEAAVRGGWRALPLPECMAGRITGVSADDDELMAVDADGRFLTMDHILSAPKDWNWSSRYGTPLWTGPGNTLPPGTLAWTWSVLSPDEDHVWRDTAGNDHSVGGAKVSHVYALTDDGHRIHYVDPWLPQDHSYEMSTPAQGRFRAVGLSTSGSTTLVVNRFGDLYTRLYDFDISGADKVFFRYSYEDQRGRPQAPDTLTERIDDHYAAIQLPAPEWTRQPKIPGQITDRVSVHKTGIGSDARELRVEGVESGRTGYWVKELTADHWDFVPTDQPLVGHLLENTAADHSVDDTVGASPYTYAGRTSSGVTVRVDSFDLAVSPTPLRLEFADGSRLDLILHTVDGLRQTVQQSGITDQPRGFDGTLEIPADILASLPDQPAQVREFLQTTLAARHFTDTPVRVTANEFILDNLGLTLSRAR